MEQLNNILKYLYQTYLKFSHFVPQLLFHSTATKKMVVIRRPINYDKILQAPKLEKGFH